MRRQWLLVLSCWSLVVGIIVRLRIHHDVPLPSSEPLWWLLSGVLQDIAILSVLILLALLFGRWAPRTAEVVFTILVVTITALVIIRSEAVVFFGAVIRPEDLRGDIPITMALQSLSGIPAVLLGLALALLVMAFIIGRRVRSVAWLRFGTVTVVAAVAAIGAVVLTREIPRAALANNPIVSLAMIQREMMESPHTRFAVSRPNLPLLSIRSFAGNRARTYIDDNYPLAYLAQPENVPVAIHPAVKPNIVFILMESVRAEEVGCYGADPPGVTPNLDALAREGIRVDRAFSAGTYTASAELAVWYGLPPVPREVLLTSRPSVPIIGLPEILRAAGWRTLLWIHGGDSNFYRRDSFYVPRGFEIVDGRSFPPTDPTTNWGYSDRALARNAITILDRAAEPFAAMLLTVTNHHPFQLPSDADPEIPLPPAGTRTLGMIQTVHYTDEAVGDFIRAARRRPWFARSIFVFTGDHGSSVQPLTKVIASNEVLLDLHNRVPLIIYSPLIPGGVVIRGPASHIDILPTLLQWIRYPASTGLGADLFDAQQTNARIVPTWNGHQRVLTLMTPSRTYHATYSEAGPLEDQSPAERLIDPVADPLGNHDLSTREPKTAARFRQLAKIYVSVYPWLLVQGRSGIPPSFLRRPVLAKGGVSSR